jgi:hypothetical protein
MSRAVPPAGTEAPDATVVAELERVELAARERRLAAQAEADRIIAEAEAEVAAIEADLEGRIATELARVRGDCLARADAEVAAIEAAVAGRTDDHDGGPTAAAPGFEAAVERLVAAVLAEPVG